MISIVVLSPIRAGTVAYPVCRANCQTAPCRPGCQGSRAPISRRMGSLTRTTLSQFTAPTGVEERISNPLLPRHHHHENRAVDCESTGKTVNPQDGVNESSVIGWMRGQLSSCIMSEECFVLSEGCEHAARPMRGNGLDSEPLGMPRLGGYCPE
jgi:hypothetical protein